SHRLALLEPRLYQPDGQIEGEVYVHGSFLQSRMYAAGVSCTDCHDPHSLTLAEDPDASCARCHRREVFDSPEHHHHRQGSAGASCVACHMPERVYMVVDPRRDHSLRVPRPDLSLTLGSSNACTDCHEDRPASWAAAAFEGWYPERSGSPHYGQTLAQGRARRAGAGEALAALADDASQPALVRASALQELATFPTEASGVAVRKALSDPDPLLRFGALRALAGLEPAGILGRALPLLEDPVRSVRMEAVRVLLGVPPELWNPADRTALARGVAEFRAGAQANADRPEAWLDLGILHRALGEPEPARSAYERALRLAPGFVPATINLVDLLRELELDDEGETQLRSGLVAAPDQADLHHALGLLLIRKQQRSEAVVSLARAAELAPDSARYAYVYGVALHSTGDAEGGVAVLETAHQRFPAEPEILFALVTIHRDRGDLERARLLADRLVAIAPRDPSVRALRSQLEAASGSGPR
ncbi:MAG: tetratricopeptide repeat protein, partial [Myxococcota bacterium]